ncbi:MAG: IS66 family transposase [Anaerolineales bacterium]|nr:IS66 family transposase [Anaerolineales bacterium]
MELAAALAENQALKTANEALRANLEAVQFQLAQLQRMVFGHKAERLNIDAQSGLLFEVAPSPAPVPQTREVSVAPKPKPVRSTLPAHLPREVEIIDLPEDEKPCPCCGGERHVIGETVCEKLDYVPATLKVLETRRLKYACRPCEGQIGVASLPASPIEQGMAAPGLLAHVLVSKFADHLPLNRQEAMLRRAGIALPRSTLCDWVLGAAQCLRPLYEHLIGCVRAGDILHSDDTPVPLREKGATVKARAWGWVNPQLRLAAYEFTVSRAGIHPQSFLAGWEGYLIADAYTGYDRLFANPHLKEVGCWAHARRKFFEVAKTQKAPGLAHEAVARIGQFYHLDNAWKVLPPDERRRRRLEQIGPLLAQFHAWMEIHLPGLLPQSPLAKAFGYAANHWAALTRFLDDGRLPLDNNAAERALRPIAVGRKNWLFAGSVRGGEAAAIVLSFVESAKLHDLNPFHYLRDVLTRLPSAKARELDSLLPHLWKPR